MAGASSVTRSVDPPYRGLLIRTGADESTGGAFVKFATKLFGDRAGHASARVRKDSVDRNDAPVVQAEAR